MTSKMVADIRRRKALGIYGKRKREDVVADIESYCAIVAADTRRGKWIADYLAGAIAVELDELEAALIVAERFERVERSQEIQTRIDRLVEDFRFAAAVSSSFADVLSNEFSEGVAEFLRRGRTERTTAIKKRKGA